MKNITLIKSFLLLFIIFSLPFGEGWGGAFAQSLDDVKTAIETDKPDAAIKALQALNAANKDEEIKPLYDNALKIVQKDLKKTKLNPEFYVILGDLYLQVLNDGGKALSAYENAVALNKNLPAPHHRLGVLYTRGRNAERALPELQEALRLDPNFADAHRDLGELYFKTSQFEKAKESYKTYMSLRGNDVESRMRYAQALYLNKEYQNAINEINQVLESDSSNQVLYRLLAYSQYETGNYYAALQAMNKYFAMAAGKKTIPMDYQYMGRILAKSGNDSLGIANLVTAINMDPTLIELHNEIADVHFKARRYDKAAEEYNTLIAKKKDNASSQDFYFLGLSEFYNRQFAEADTAFGRLTEKSPSWATGYLWRASANAQLDPETKLGLAKPFYEKFIELANVTPDKFKKDLIDAYFYLGYYYYLAKDTANARLHYGKVLELDPSHKGAADAMKVLK